MASEGTEGITFGLLTTIANLGGPFGRAIGNQIYRLFSPSLSDPANYVKDAREFRDTVAWWAQYHCHTAELEPTQVILGVIYIRAGSIVILVFPSRPEG